MKNNIALIFIGLVFSFTLSFGQNKAKDEAYNLIANDVCKMIKKEDFSSMSLKQKEVKLGLFMIQSYGKHKKTNKYLKNTKFDDMSLLGEEIGVKMAEICGVEFVSLFSGDELENLVDEDVVDSTDKTSDEVITFEAIFISVHNDAVSYIKVLDDFNKEHNILILNDFEGGKLLKKENIKKKFKVSYEEYSLYDLSEQGYTNKKVLKSIEL
ncbi:hypothetical protein [Pseudofulvibacter geojedonensis]|uniref:Uncharacterized protein n=1 Tax=Pseudofulvibacter geojedonensis TaxID=1123758 RepID=A0ABW3I2T6_9FLAO